MTLLQNALLLTSLLATGVPARAERIEKDPAPPTVHPVPSGPSPVAQAFDRLITHAAPSPRKADTVTGDWTHFLGPEYDLISKESGLRRTWEKGGEPRLLWEVGRGAGYAPPVAAFGKLVTAQNLDGKETVECLDAETGQRFWIHQVKVDFGQAFGYPEAPAAPPTIDADRVYVIGTRALLRCYDLKTGTILWSRDLAAEMEVGAGFFGKGGAPLIKGNLVILTLGGKDDYAVAAFDKMSGRLVWVTRQEWEGSYASPVPAILHGKERIIVFAGGKSSPPHGGLLSVDPATGDLDFAFPWRAKREASVNGMSPRIVGNRIFISEAYTEGGVLLGIGETMQPTVVKALPDLKIQFPTPLVLENRYLYGITEKTIQSATLFCLDMQTGVEKWRKLNFGRGNLLQTADGTYATGEAGQFMSLNLSPDGPEILSEMQPFKAPDSFTPPTIYNGLLYLIQSTAEPGGGASPRLLCFDLRK